MPFCNCRAGTAPACGVPAAQSESGNSRCSEYIMSRCSMRIEPSAASTRASRVSNAARVPESILHCPGGRDELQPPRAAGACLAADLVAEAEHQSAPAGVLRQQRRRGRETLGEREDVLPAAARRLLLVDGDRGAALAGPLLERLAVVGE